MEDFDLNNFLLDLVDNSQEDFPDVQQLLDTEMPLFQDDFLISPPNSCPPTPISSFEENCKDFGQECRTAAPELEHVLKQTNPLQEIGTKRKYINSNDKNEKVKTKKIKSEEIDTNVDEVQKRKFPGFVEQSPFTRTVKWSNYRNEDLCKLYDSSHAKTKVPSLLVICDKGFTFSPSDNVFICQKKNHFQITMVLDVPNSESSIKVKDTYQNITSYQAHVYAVKTESPDKMINLEQSLINRTKKPFHPVEFPTNDSSSKKITIGRLHFCDTTLNNMRKKGKLNPNQRYFTLVVDIHACTKDGNYSICRQASQKLIVRASNPGQFDNDVSLWSRDKFGDSIHRIGNVGINNDKPEECLSVNGNVRLTGEIFQPADRRIQDSLQKSNVRQHLENICRIKLYKYRLNKDYAEYAGLSEEDKEQLGVVAQELKALIPRAVKEASDITLPSGNVVKDLLLINQNRILMESVGALQGLFQITKILTARLVQLESRNEILEIILNSLTECHSTDIDSYTEVEEV